jgi:hypothetical protein
MVTALAKMKALLREMIYSNAPFENLHSAMARCDLNSPLMLMSQHEIYVNMAIADKAV